MTPIEKQVLENQKWIMFLLNKEENFPDSMIHGSFADNYKKNIKLLESKKSKEPCYEMPEEKTQE